MTENKRFKLDNFDSVCEMLELLNTQRLVIVDMEKENQELKKENEELQASNEYWKGVCLSKYPYNKFHHKAPIWFTQELKLTNKEVNKVAEAIEQNLKERRTTNE